MRLALSLNRPAASEKNETRRRENEDGADVYDLTKRPWFLADDCPVVIGNGWSRVFATGESCATSSGTTKEQTNTLGCKHLALRANKMKSELSVACVGYNEFLVDAFFLPHAQVAVRNV